MRVSVLVTRACIKARILTGTYTLQAKRSKFKKHSYSDANCLICKQEPETRMHFILMCNGLSDTRTKYMPVIFKTVCEDVGRATAAVIWQSDEKKLQVILDCSAIIKGVEHKQKIEQESRKLLFALHVQRSTTLGIPIAKPGMPTNRPPPKPPPDETNLQVRRLPDGNRGAS